MSSKYSSDPVWSWKEIEIPVLNGFIRGKLWCNFGSDSALNGQLEDSLIGKPDGNSIKQMNGCLEAALEPQETNVSDRFIALHGWQDNCGTFDNLIPLLLKHEKDPGGKGQSLRQVTIAAIDLPGHGLSSHYPVGAFYTDLAFAIDLKRVVDFLGWQSFSLLGHSMGGYVSIFYASLFPEEVRRVIALDILKPLTFKPEDLSKRAASSIKSFLEIESKIYQQDVHVRRYTKHTAVERLLEGHSKIGILQRQSAITLLERGSKVVPAQDSDLADGVTNEEPKFVFTRDPRLHAIFFSRLDVTTVKAYLASLRCELFVIKAKDGIKLDEDDVNQEFMRLYKSVCKSFELIEVEGRHHFHLCEPNGVAREINRILLKSQETNDTIVCNGSHETSQTSSSNQPNGSLQPCAATAEIT